MKIKTHTGPTTFRVTADPGDHQDVNARFDSWNSAVELCVEVEGNAITMFLDAVDAKSLIHELSESVKDLESP